MRVGHGNLVFDSQKSVFCPEASFFRVCIRVILKYSGGQDAQEQWIKFWIACREMKQRRHAEKIFLE